MHRHASKPKRRAIRLAELLVLVVIPGALAAMLVPGHTDASQGGSAAKLQAQLHDIRAAIELYNVQNPLTRYWAGTFLAFFWDPLLEGGYLEQAPENPLNRNSTAVVAAPAFGAGWVWAESSPGDPWTLNLYAVGENGNLFDGDGNGLPD